MLLSTPLLAADSGFNKANEALSNTSAGLLGLAAVTITLATMLVCYKCKRHIQTVFCFCPRFLTWTLTRTWTIQWTKKRLTPVCPGDLPPDLDTTIS